MTPAIIALKEEANRALDDKTLPDTEADALITKINADLTAAGMPSGGCIISRAEYKAAYGIKA